MSTRNVFNPAECDRFDNSARKCGRLLSRQSDRNLPRCFFPSGATGGKKNGHEMQGVILNVLIIMLSAEHDKFVHLFGGDKFGIDRVNNWILLLE
jgi:hypothetical protein